MKRTCITSVLVALAALAMCSSCTEEDRFNTKYMPLETHTIFNISVVKNTRTKSAVETSAVATRACAVDTKAYIDDSKTSYDAESNRAFIDANTAFGVVGLDVESKDVLIDAQPVKEVNGVRSANLVTSVNSCGSMSVSAFYPFVNSVSYREDGSYSVTFAPNDIKKGALTSGTVGMRCDQGFETVNLKFHHITNSIGFKVCDITGDEQLRGLMHIRKVVLHGMPTEGMFVCDGSDSYWVPNAKRQDIVFFEGDGCLEYGEERARFVGANAITDIKEDCNRSYVVPELLTEKVCVEVFFDVDPFDYDGTHYRGATECSEIIPLSGVVPDDKMEMGLQYTFVLGVNLESVYRTIEFSASIDDWEKYNGRILDFDNE